MGEVIKRILDQLGGANLGIALVFLAAGYLCWLWIGTTAADKKKVLRRQISVVLLIAVLAGAAILVNHFVFQRELGFSKNLTGVLVARIVGDDERNSLQSDLVAKLNAELQKEETAQEIVVHASSKIVNENDGLKVAHEHARAIGQRLNAKIVIWGRKIGENKFYPRITVMAPLKGWSAARERTHAEQSITELHLPEELVDEPFYLIHFAAGYSYYVQGEYEEALPHFKAALGRQGAFPNELADLQFFTAFCHSLLGANDEAIADYDKVIRLDPKYAAAYNNRGIVYQDKREYDNAFSDPRRAPRPTRTRRTTTRLLTATTKPSELIQNSQKLIESVAPPTKTRGNTTGPLPIMTKLSDSIQNSRTLTITSHGFLEHVLNQVSATGRKLWSMQPKPVNCRIGKIHLALTRWLPPMPKWGISSRRSSGKRISSEPQTYPAKTPPAAKADWHFTKPTCRTTQRSNLDWLDH